MGETAHFIYVNARGEVSERKLERFRRDGGYLQSVVDGKHRTFREDRILAWVSDGDDAAALVAQHQQQWTVISAERVQRFREELPNRGALEVCFTGFAAAEKQALMAQAIEHGLAVRKSVTVGLSFLVCGPNAGPKKRQNALAIGALILIVPELLEMMETGEIPV